jgi:hypothetical protein
MARKPMVRAEWMTPNGFQLSGEFESPKDMFSVMGMYAELFRDSECGVCHGKAIAPRVRTAGDNDEYTYYELVCLNQDCRARLSFGEMLKDKDALFPKRKGEDKKFLPNNGWAKFEREGGHHTGPQGGNAPPPAASRPPSPPPPAGPPRGPTQTPSAEDDDPTLGQFLQRAALNKANEKKVVEEICTYIWDFGEAAAQQAWEKVDEGRMERDAMIRTLWGFLLVLRREAKKQ